MRLNNEWVNKEIKEEIERYLETSEDENPTTQNVWDTVKTVPIGKVIAIQTYLEKRGKLQVNNLT